MLFNIIHLYPHERATRFSWSHVVIAFVFDGFLCLPLRRRRSSGAPFIYLLNKMFFFAPSADMLYCLRALYRFETIQIRFNKSKSPFYSNGSLRDHHGASWEFYSRSIASADAAAASPSEPNHFRMVHIYTLNQLPSAHLFSPHAIHPLAAGWSPFIHFLTRRGDSCCWYPILSDRSIHLFIHSYIQRTP